jgi:tRNA G18 (ribose-2'-O)-methylase SpoU
MYDAPMEIIVVLHDIRSAHNVGSIFRTADGAGVSHIVLSGYTPLPIDRFGRVLTAIYKTALGATETVPWSHVDDTRAYLDELRARGVTIVVVEQDVRAIPYTAGEYTSPVAFVFGNEIEGVPRDCIDAAHIVVHIPMHGEKESLNVGVAAGIVLFHAANKLRTQ